MKTGVARMKPTLRTLPLNLLLSISSIAICLAAFEIGYRSYLFYQTRIAHYPDDRLNYEALSHPLTRFHPEFGYEYVPNQIVDRAVIRSGYPVLCSQARINQYGSPSPYGELPGDDPFTILVFGDSFTANLFAGGLTWPDALQAELQAAVGPRIRVLNFARSAFGILQMFDLARGEIAELNPDLVLFAFITDDLTRARSWRTTTYQDGNARVLASPRPIQAPKPGQAVDVALHNPGITHEWCDSMLASTRADDELLSALNRWYRKLRREYRAGADFATLSTSFVFDRLVHGTAFRDQIASTIISRLADSTYGTDPRFTESLFEIHRTGVPYYLIHLPTYPDLRDRRHHLDEQERDLIEDLDRVTKGHILDFLSHYVKEFPDGYPGDLGDLFLSPHDLHPSKRGVEFYGHVVSEMLQTEGILQDASHSWK
jgi:hypothetical protein